MIRYVSLLFLIAALLYHVKGYAQEEYRKKW